MKVTGDIPNLVNGVSQQAAALRLPTQGELQINYYSTIVEGLRKRPPTEHVAKLLVSAPEGAFFHIIDRDENEKYVVVVTSEDLKVYDFDGNQKTVTFPDGKDYLWSLDPVRDFRALTVADYTFIVNRDVFCYMDESVVEPTRANEAVVNIKSGNYGKTYRITLNGSIAASYTTPIGDNANQSSQIATTYIASQLYDALVANGYNAGGWSVGIHQNALHIVRTSGDFTISVVDGVNGNASSLAKGSIQKFSDLPTYGPHGFVVEIGNSSGTSLDNYWVRADKGGTNNNSQVVWRECPKPGTQLNIDASTMPHVLVRNENGTFTFKQAVWDPRKSGDDKISPDPTFIGSTIEDVVFHRNRLGFLTDESVVFSRAGSFFDFFRTTATALLDDDPIDVAASHIKVSMLRHSIPFQDYLLLFSDQTQFRLAGNDLLTPKTVSIRPLTEYDTSPRVKPIAIGPSVFFVSDDANGQYAQVYEYSLDKAAEIADADEVTAHVPSLIPSGAHKIVGSSDENTLVLLTKGRAGSLYVYRYYWVTEDKVQSAWSEWTFEGANILSAAMIGSELFIVAERSDGVFLERLRMEPAAYDLGMDLRVNLDRRITEEDAGEGIYIPESNTTEYTLPFLVHPNTKVVNRPGGTGIPGVEINVKEVSGTTITLAGDTRTMRFYMGFPYVSRYRFSPFYHRQVTQTGGQAAKVDGRLQIFHLSVGYNRSAYFRVEVETENRPVVSYEMSGITIGSPSAIIGSVVLDSGRFSVPIMSRNDRVKIDLVNDTWLPSNFLSAAWRGIWNPKARQI